MGATKLMTAAGGGITLDAASTASDKTITVPADNGTLVYANSSGNVGIGTSSPTDKLSVAGGVRATSSASWSSADGAVMDWVSGTARFVAARTGANNSVMTFSTFNSGNPNECMRIDSSGNLLVGATAVAMTNGGIQSQPNGNTTSVPFFGCAGNSSSNSYISLALYSTSASQYQFYVGYGGTVYARSTSITGLSDQREKENIRALDVGLNEVLALQPRRFDWKDGSTSNVAGFVAQEVETVLPDLVEEYRINDDGETRFGLKMGDMIPVLVKAIQELKAELDAAKADIAALKGTA